MARIEVGDYVGVVENEWIVNNPRLSNHDISKNLFGYKGPKPVGVVIKLSMTRHMAIVMDKDGNLQPFKITRLAVMN
tara:strand:+ start:124 stop:354 length:231 start_codon:yes stop_codon:yes gene_type:complete